MMDDGGDDKQPTMLQRIDRAVGAALPSGLGGSLCVLAERQCRVNLCPTMEEFMAMTEAEFEADAAFRSATESSMPWFWREVYQTGMNLLSIENNLDDLRRLEYWRKVYLHHPDILFLTVFETLCLALFGNIWGPAYKAKILRLLERALKIIM